MDTNTIPAADTASGIVLTIKGEAYYEATHQFEINGVPLPEGVTPAEWRAKARERIEHHLDCAKALIDALDFLARDPDLEPNGDDEPSLGWPMGHGLSQLRTDMPHDDDREQDDADYEDGGDDEPLEDDEEEHCATPVYPDEPHKAQYLSGLTGGSKP